MIVNETTELHRHKHHIWEPVHKQNYISMKFINLVPKRGMLSLVCETVVFLSM